MKKLFLILTLAALNFDAYAMDEATQETKPQGITITPDFSKFQPSRNPKLYKETDTPYISTLFFDFKAEYRLPEQPSVIETARFAFSSAPAEGWAKLFDMKQPIFISKEAICKKLLSEASFLEAAAKAYASGKHGTIEVTSTNVVLYGYIMYAPGNMTGTKFYQKRVPYEGHYLHVKHDKFYDSQNQSAKFEGLPQNITLGFKEFQEEQEEDTFSVYSYTIK